MGFSNFSTLDGTATDRRPLITQRDDAAGNDHWRDEPRIPKYHDGGGRWTKVAANDEPPRQLEKPSDDQPAQTPPEGPRFPTPYIVSLIKFYALLVRVFRAQNRELDIFGTKGPPSPTTVAVTRMNGRDVYGVNSGYVTDPAYRAYPEMDRRYRTYGDDDRSAAMQYLDILIRKYPEVMNTDNITQKPNDALFHAEATLLLRAAAENGGTLGGKTLEVYVDRPICWSCRRMLPYLAYELGNPTVIFTDSTGTRRLYRDKTLRVVN